MSSPSHFLRNGTVNIVHQIPKSFRIAPPFPGKSLDGRHDRFSVPVDIQDNFSFSVSKSLQDGVTSIPGFHIPGRTVGILAVVPEYMPAHGSVISFRHSVHLPRLLHPDLDPVDDLKAAQTGQESNTFHEGRYTGCLVGGSGGMERGKVVAA